MAVWDDVLGAVGIATGNPVVGATQIAGPDVAKKLYDRWHQGLEDTPIDKAFHLPEAVPGNYTPSDSGSDKAKAKTEAKAKAKKKQTQTVNPVQNAAEALGALGEGLANENEALTNQTTQAIEGKVPGETGQATPPSGAAILGANTAPGQTPGSAEAWLNSNIAAANAADSPMQQAMNNYAAAFAQGEGGVTAALQSSGAANQASIETAPEQGYLSLLTPNRYYGLTGTQAASLPLSLQYALYNAGIQGISVPKGGWPKSVTGGGKAQANPLSGVGTTPGTAVPGALQPGTGSAPS